MVAEPFNVFSLCLNNPIQATACRQTLQTHGPCRRAHDPAGGHTDPAGGHTDPAGGHMDPAGEHTDPAGGHTDPAGGHSDPAGRHTDPTGRHSGTQTLQADAAEGHAGGTWIPSLEDNMHSCFFCQSTVLAMVSMSCDLDTKYKKKKKSM